MKLKTLGMLAGAALLLPSAGAFAHTDVFVGLGFAAPAPVVVEREPAYYDDYYYEPSRVYVERDYVYPRRYYAPRVYAYSRGYDRGYHRGWREHERHEHHGHWHDDD
jgi:hypothetical protein